MTEAGTNQAADVTALLNLARASTNERVFLTALPPLTPGETTAGSATLLEDLPKAYFRSSNRDAANAAVKTLSSVGAQSPALDCARGT